MPVAEFQHGTIPTQIGQLTKLQYLDWSTNGAASYQRGLAGTIPTQIGRLTKLRMIDLDGNQLGGVVPAELDDLLLNHPLGLAPPDPSIGYNCNIGWMNTPKGGPETGSYSCPLPPLTRVKCNNGEVKEGSYLPCHW